MIFCRWIVRLFAWILHRLARFLIDSAEDGFKAPAFGFFECPTGEPLSHRVHELDAALLVAGDQAIAHGFERSLQPLPAFHQLIRAFMRFFERSPEGSRNLLHVPLRVDSEDDAYPNRGRQQHRHQRPNLRIGGLHLFVAPVDLNMGHCAYLSSQGGHKLGAVEIQPRIAEEFSCTQVVHRPPGEPHPQFMAVAYLA